MMRLSLTLAGWLVLALAFVTVMRWLKARANGADGAAHGAGSQARVGPALSATQAPLPAVLEPHRAALEALLEPAAQLAAGGAPVARLGGDARLPADAEWPRSPTHPMSFVGEIDLPALRRVAPDAARALPEEGILALFYDVEEMPWGYEPAHGAFFRVLHLEGPLAKRTAPAGAAVFEERVLGAKAVRTLPDPEDLPADLRLGDAIEPYVGHAAALVAEPDHRVGGHPHWIQSDAREEAAIVRAGGSAATPEAISETRARLDAVAAKVWRLLWQIDTDDEAGFMWGDGGRLYLLARDEDLRARRFDRVWLVLQCY